MNCINRVLRAVVFLLFFVSSSAFAGTLLSGYQVASTCATPDVSEPEKQNCSNCWQTRGRPVWSAKNCRWEQGPCTGEKPKSPLCSSGREYIGRFNNNSCTWERASSSTCRAQSSDEYGGGQTAAVVISCTQNSHCGSDKICSNRTCVCPEGKILKTSTNTCVECTSNGHCSGEETCSSSNVCTPPTGTTCTTSTVATACASNQRCVGGVCTNCPPNKVAKHANNTCVECHSENSTLCTDGKRCVDNACVVRDGTRCTPETVGTLCESNQICAAGICVDCPGNNIAKHANVGDSGHNQCFECHSGNRDNCSGQTPYCHNGRCVECKNPSNSPTWGHGVCRAKYQGAKPFCTGDTGRPRNICAATAEGPGLACTEANVGEVCEFNQVCREGFCSDCEDGKVGHHGRGSGRYNTCVECYGDTGDSNPCRTNTNGERPYCHRSVCVECKNPSNDPEWGNRKCAEKDSTKPICSGNDGDPPNVCVAAAAPPSTPPSTTSCTVENVGTVCGPNQTCNDSGVCEDCPDNKVAKHDVGSNNHNQCFECVTGKKANCTEASGKPYCHHGVCVECKKVDSHLSAGDAACAAKYSEAGELKVCSGNNPTSPIAPNTCTCTDLSCPSSEQTRNESCQCVCPQGKTLRDAECVTTCTGIGDCGDNQICSDGACQSCGSNQVAKVATGIRHNTCVECYNGNTTLCGSNERCEHNRCVAVAVTDPCNAQNKVTHPGTNSCVECYGGEETGAGGTSNLSKCTRTPPLCHHNVCVECKEDRHCDSGKTCIGNVCRTTCNTNDDCTPPTTCREIRIMGSSTKYCLPPSWRQGMPSRGVN